MASSDETVICELCLSTDHYLRQKENRKEQTQPSKFTRYDYLSHEDLLKKARLSSKKLKIQEQKLKKLEKFK